MKFPVKELLVAASLATGGGAIVERIASLGASPSLVVYAGLYAALALSLVLAGHIRGAVLRIGCALVLGVSGFVFDASERIMGDHLNYDAFINLLNSMGFADDAVAQHGGLMLGALVGPALLFAGIALPPRRVSDRVARIALAAPVLGVLGLAGILFARGGEGERGLPGPFVPLAFSALYGYDSATGNVGPRQAVTLVPAAVPPARDVVLIVDESVLATYLDINRPSGVRSGLKDARPGVTVVNYGVAAAITNCSVGSNVDLRFGGTRDAYRRINATMPSIWAYARKAGFRTVYIDGQRTGGQLQNLMTADEVREIDMLVQFDRVAVRDRDMAVADRLAALLNDGVAQFIFVNKIGAHFPVHDKYPDRLMRYRPALPRGRFRNVGDTGSRAGFGGAAGEWTLYRNSYRNTLLWNVGAFFDRLLSRADASRATMIYTSDHGQDLHERGRRGVNTHCNVAPRPEEGMVPLVVIEGAGLRTLDWSRHHAGNVDRVSHYGVFPTLLALMGYDPGAVGPLYGPSLADRSTDPGTFNTTFNARLGREPIWAGIRQPPAR
ncbi:MAG TPA: sulfatase-like hydrolase/transferase [Sphingomonas sp.]|uniref:sulfatase-like hydrolase/transferase n=1 Tax=Sphingomonas sp. TaxID=28214 RepID=UPI002ED84B1B